MINTNSLWQFDEDENILIYKDNTDILQDYKDLFKSFWNDISLEANTPQMQLIAFLAETDNVTIKKIADLVNMFFNGGSGKILDMQMWNLFRAERKKGVLGYATLKITGISGTQIPSGYEVSNGNQNFITTSDAEIGENGEIEVIVTAKEINENIALANTITTQITPILGIETIINPSSSIAGISAETDSQFYNRCITYNSLYRSSSFKSIMANVAQITGVTKINGYENPTAEVVRYKGIDFQPHSFGIVLIGGDDTEIGAMIRDTKSVGSYSQGSTEITFTDEALQTKSVFRFYRPTATPLKFSVKARLYKQSPKSYKKFIIDGLNLFINNLQIGDYFTQPQVAEYLQKYISGFDIVDLKIAKKTGNLGYEPIALTFLENATIADDDIAIDFELAENMN